LVLQAFEEEIYGGNHSTVITGDTETLSANTDSKVFQTPMSVPQLALFVRLLVESGTIKCQNQSLLLRAIAASFSTAKATSISSESLRIKYYATDPASVNIVKEYVIKMMNQLRRF
jgi:hypothetical protein